MNKQAMYKVREYWDVDGHITKDCIAQDQYDLYLQAYGDEEEGQLTLKDFEGYIDYLKDEESSDLTEPFLNLVEELYNENNLDSLLITYRWRKQ